MAPIYINVKDHGAKGDGITDDTAAFQDAVAASLANGLRRLAREDALYDAGADENTLPNAD